MSRGFGRNLIFRKLYEGKHPVVIKVVETDWVSSFLIRLKSIWNMGQFLYLGNFKSLYVISPSIIGLGMKADRIEFKLLLTGVYPVVGSYR
jgi:hypothetical protein